MSELIYLSIGSNIGDREANLASAITILGTYPEISNIRSASFYESEPLYIEDQPLFLNTVVECETEFTPFQFLEVIKRIETMLGRPKVRKKNSPRIIDIDILCFGTAVIETKELTIPHRGLAERRFVLVPFNEIAPSYKIPLLDISVKKLLNLCLDNTRVVKHKIESSA